ncbi:PREDICTED: uncharacterized protein LOC109128338 [Camelina sativa]|uniref:Uncharacterized protein LOC109128338 n=1 Tax=Camelina sativa TaxID=90675 RepID=A0ABM1QTI0_CAMSA|nr:PREDICTED: uncharacterized protein LOC109128338 [Camelina sativa]
MDVHNAFLHGDLEEEVYMKLPHPFRHSHPDKVFRLRKSLYGLKQAPRCWFNNDSYMLQKFKHYLGKCSSMKDLGKLKYFLGIEVSRGSEENFLSQRKYALDIVADSGNLGSRPADTPLEQNHDLDDDDGPLLTNPTPYFVHVLSQFMQELREAHWEAALRVVKFLKGSPRQGILLCADSDLSLTVYCDSNWSSCPITRRSLSAFVVLFGGSPIAWKTKKQKIVSHSSAEAEYRAMSMTLREI